VPSRFCRMLICLHTGVFLLVSGFCTHLFAQSASVHGQVLDSGGAAIPGAAIELLTTETKVTLKTVSDASGVFIISPLTSGTYQATVTAPGFATWVESGIKVWDRRSLAVVRRLDTRHMLAIALAYSDDSRTLVAADRERVYYWPVAPSPWPFAMLLLANAGVISWITVTGVRDERGSPFSFGSRGRDDN